MTEWVERRGKPRDSQDGTFIDPITGEVFLRETFVARDGALVTRRFTFDPGWTPVQAVEALHEWRSDYGFSVTNARAEDPEIGALVDNPVFGDRLVQMGERRLYEAELLFSAAEAIKRGTEG